MPWFWIAAAILSAAAGWLVISRAARDAAPGADETPERSVYRRQLLELDDLRARGLIEPDAFEVARTEAARRLLTADKTAQPADRVSSPRERLLALVAAVVIAVAALGIYLAVGSPGRPDQPFAARLKALRAADPATLGPAQMAALLRDHAKSDPKNPEVWSFLGKASAEAGDAPAAARAFEKAVRLDPTRTADWEALGETLVQLGEGRVPPQAEAAFNEALKRDPNSRPAHFFLGQAAFEAGRKAEGLAQWRTLAGLLPEGPGRAALEQRIGAVESGRAEAAQQIAAAPPADQNEMIRGMVEGLAARLETSPDDVEGWTRLVRSYGVLGDTAAQKDALAKARKQFAGRAADLAKIEAAAR
jgi:cytochrome c-type biogenesis protein CcmH